MRRIASISALQVALWTICVGLGSYIVVDAALHERWGRALFFLVIGAALAWALSEKHR